MNYQNNNLQINCNLCGLQDHRILEAGERPYKLVKCNRCGLIYMTPFPENVLLQNKYNSNYYLMLNKLTSRSAQIWQNRLKMINSFSRKGKLLDVGCGDGTFLSLAKNNGWEVHGVEISKAGCIYIKERFSIEVYNGELKDAGYPDGYFDVITLWHSLEHMTDPAGNLIIANRLLRNDGLLALATPNIDNYIYKVLYLIGRVKRKPHFLFEDKEKEKEWHLYLFSPHTIKTMLKKTGFSVFLLASDASGLTWLKRIIDKIANYILFPLRMKIVLCMQLYSRKEVKIAEISSKVR